MDAKTVNVKKVQDDGFILVSHRRKKKQVNKIYSCSKSPINDRNETGLAFKKHTLRSIQNEVENSEFFNAFRENLVAVLNHITSFETSSKDATVDFVAKESSMNVQSTVDVICYGLGNFSSSVISRYQLGFLLALKGMLGTDCTHVYDPMFSEQEIGFLEEVGLNVLRINEEAKRTVERTTIFFMPHCELQLYNNLFSANWNPKSLRNLILIGNSFENYKLQLCGRTFKELAKYTYYVTEFETEIVIANSFYLTEIFNDMCIHYFRLQDLPSAQCHLWNDVADLHVSATHPPDIDQLCELLSAKV